MSAQQSPEYLTVGRILRPHGVRGAVLLDATTELVRSLIPGVELLLGPDRQPASVRKVSQHQKRYILYLEGLHERALAEKMRGWEVQLPFAQAEPLPEGSYFYWQILGLRVVSDTGQALGQVAEIIETGANDVYVVRKEGAKDLLLPAIADVILEIDLEREFMTVHLLPGLIP